MSPTDSADISPTSSGAGKAESPLLKTFETSRAKPFDNVSLEEYYKPIDSYEGRHRWDPDFVWDAKEERRVVRKVNFCHYLSREPSLTFTDRYEDLHMGTDFSTQRPDFADLFQVCFMFFALQLDRGNISQALSDNMLEDLGITTNDYNTGQTIFYLTFLFAELPCISSPSFANKAAR